MRREHRGQHRTRLGIAMFLMLAACAGGDADDGSAADRGPAPAVTGSASVSPLPGAAPGVGCPQYGLWQSCSVEERIARAGLAVNRREDGVRHDFMHVEGLVWETSRAEVQVFLYPSEAERRRDTDALDTVTVSPRGKRIHWGRPATLVTSQNLAAIILSLNPRQAERIALALGAGLPAAPR